MSEIRELIHKLGQKAIKLSGSTSTELERSCWMIVHEYRHGVTPVEYDIREIDEDLYLDVLNYTKEKVQTDTS